MPRVTRATSLNMKSGCEISRLPRQTGTSNLFKQTSRTDKVQEVINRTDLKKKGLSNSVGGQPVHARPQAKHIRSTVAFTVYEDPPESESGAENDENNVFNQIEKRLKEDKKVVSPKKSTVKREPLTNLLPSAPFATPEQNEDLSNPAASGYTFVRDELSACAVDETVDSQSTVYGSALDDGASEYMTAVSTKDIQQDIIYAFPEYQHDIYKYMLSRQESFRPRANYLSKQPELSAEMRRILLDWLSDVAIEYDLQQESLHLAVSLVDRLLSLVRIDRSRLQLVGAAAMMIASKYEEIYPPELKEFVYITHDTYTTKQILGMEKLMLQQLEFNVSVPTSQYFASYYLTLQKTKNDRRIRHAVQYLLDLSLLDERFLACKPSHVAAACVCYGNILTGPEPWPEVLESRSQIDMNSLVQLIEMIHENFRSAPDSQFTSIFTRYSCSAMDSVAELPAPEMDKIFSA